MNKIISFVVVTTMTLFMVGCSSIPKEEDLQQLSKAQLSELLPGKTLTRPTKYGRWASYYIDGSTGYSKAWGSWGEEKASQTYTISQDGEMCTVFNGEFDWAKPKHQYCSFVYTDQTGLHYSKSTKDTWKPERVGQWRKIEYIGGDKYGLVGK